MPLQVLSLGLAFATLAMGVGREHGASRWINIGPIQLHSTKQKACLFLTRQTGG